MMEELLNDRNIVVNFDEQIVFEQLEQDENAIWSLLLASGYLKVKKVEYENGKRKCEREEVVMVDQEVYYPPELGAQVFWLKNRKPDKLREKVENKIETEEDGVGVMILTPVKEAAEDE